MIPRGINPLHGADSPSASRRGDGAPHAGGAIAGSSVTPPRSSTIGGEAYPVPWLSYFLAVRDDGTIFSAIRSAPDFT